MSTNLVVAYGQRTATLKVNPTTTLNSVRSDACGKFGLEPANWALKRNNKQIDLSLPLRFANLPPGARLELVQSTPKSSTTPVQIVLRTYDTPGELKGSFLPSNTLWDVLRKLENEAKAAGNRKINITERCQPSGISSGPGRLLYEMPTIRVMNTELDSFEQLAQTLESIGCGSGRQLLVVRFKKTEIPYEDALKDILQFTKEPSGTAVPPADTKASLQAANDVSEDTEMLGSPHDATVESEEATSEAKEKSGEAEASEPRTVPNDPAVHTSVASVPIAMDEIIVFAPSADAATLAAAQLDNADSDYDIGIADLKRIRHNYQQEAQPKRLLSDKELEEKHIAEQEKMKRVESLSIKVRLPDGYHVVKKCSAGSTSASLYTAIRSTLQYPNEPFTLLIPPADTIPESDKRLTLDLKLRSNTTLHLRWANGAKDTVRKGPALNEEYRSKAIDLPKPTVPEPTPHENGADDGTQEASAVDAKKEKKGENKEAVEKKLKNFLRLGRK